LLGFWKRKTEPNSIQRPFLLSFKSFVLKNKVIRVKKTLDNNNNEENKKTKMLSQSRGNEDPLWVAFVQG
jgi:hypothetical protein